MITFKHRLIKFVIILALVMLMGLGGFFLLKMVYSYSVKGDTPTEGWLITQYGGNDKPQMMFYTIVDPSGNLVVIDGGWGELYPEVAAVIRDYGWHVNAWIITHPHYDHCGAFNAIMAEEDLRRKIKIDHIYVTDVHEEAYEKSAKEYDNIDVYYKYKETIADMDNVTVCHAGDEFNIIGLKMEVISAWDDHVDTFENNQCNDGSLMFKLSGENESMLFCSDVQKEMEQFIVPGNEEKLKADYVQCGHHGNWGLTTEFYDIVDPKAAFMDSPSYILEDTEGYYDAPQLVEYFNNRGTAIYSFKDAPNTVNLH